MSLTIDAIAELARRAGALAGTYFGHVRAEIKPDGTLVTEADRAVQRLIVDQLRHWEPDARALYILDEEETATPNHGVSGPQEADEVVAVDPIDGTTSFATGLPLWGVSIGLLKKNRPQRGAVYFPLLGGPTGWMYQVGRSGPATLNDASLAVRPHGGWNTFSQIGVPSGFHRWGRLQGFRGKHRNLGSTAHHLCLVASGALDAAIIGTAHLWDVAAGAAILERAGGVLQTTAGDPADWPALYRDEMPTAPLVAGSPEALAALIEILELSPPPKVV